MSVIEFTINSCKDKNTMNKQIIENFEQHLAMYSFTNLKNMPNIEVSKTGNTYIISAETDTCKDIIDSLSSYRCSNFNNTLIPVFTLIDKGLQIEFIIDGE